tara:strand:- start:4419 stop:4730 length:312 start_codon:yes stop_codon:yes gene_type:complete
MIVKLVEVYEIAARHKNQRGVSSPTFCLREIFVNPQHVVCLRSEFEVKRLLEGGNLPEGLDARQEFTKLHLNRGQVGMDVTVVGAPSIVEQKLSKTDKEVIKG